MNSNKITSRPPQRKSQRDFILEAEIKNRNEQREKKQELPWENPTVRSDVQKVFTIKLPEEYIFKIRYISEQTNISQQKIVREIICTQIEEQLKELL